MRARMNEPLRPLVGHSLRVAEIYNDLAGSYDQTFQTNLALAENEFIFKELGERIQPGQTVLDAGCGTGLFLEYLYKHATLYHGIDISDGMLEQAKKKFPRHSFEQGNMEALTSIVGASYDWAISLFNSWSYCDHPRRALNEFNRALRTGGGLYLMAASPRYPKRPSYILNQHEVYSDIQPISAIRLREMAQFAGFRNVRVRGFNALAESYLTKRSKAFLAGYLSMESRLIGRYWPDRCYFLILEGEK